jgi:hypothetical protein
MASLSIPVSLLRKLQALPVTLAGVSEVVVTYARLGPGQAGARCAVSLPSRSRARALTHLLSSLGVTPRPHSKFVKNEMPQLKYANPDVTFRRVVVDKGGATLLVRSGACAASNFDGRRRPIPSVGFRLPGTEVKATVDIQGKPAGDILQKVLAYAQPN